MIGDMHTVALVGTGGTIDWLCIPHFDSPTVFGAMLDDQKGGFFALAPLPGEEAVCKQFYWPDTNVLVTRFLANHGAAELTDFMPVGAARRPGPRRHELIRRLTVLRGRITFRMECRPAFNYARDAHTTRVVKGGAIFASPKLDLGLASQIPLSEQDGSAVAQFTLAEGETAVFVLRDRPIGASFEPTLSEQEAEDAFRSTVSYWRGWLSQCPYRGRWREIVYRSALALKLMTFEPTGAIVAAPTCSLPEEIGGERNWDYRYTWIRDAAFVVYALLRLGFSQEAGAYMHFLSRHVCDHEDVGPLQLMYGIGGETHLEEEVLTHLDGYKGSKPVRIGNAAYRQLQLDIYGELLDAVYLYNKHGAPLSYEDWRWVRKLVDWVCDNWQREDASIWEVRGSHQHFTYSKLMCWVAVDRGLRLAEKRSFPADRERWYAVRDTIYEAIMAEGWNEERQAFVQAFGSDQLDAANLMMPLTFFVAPADPRILKTIEATMRPLDRGGLLANNLVYRYDPERTDDGVPGSEGTFNICTFWLVEALTRAGRFEPRLLEEARLMFERMLGFANHVGLYAEETGFHGEALGNFPQAFTHLALISAAFNLDRALGHAD